MVFLEYSSVYHCLGLTFQTKVSKQNSYFWNLTLIHWVYWLPISFNLIMSHSTYQLIYLLFLVFFLATRFSSSPDFQFHRCSAYEYPSLHFRLCLFYVSQKSPKDVKIFQCDHRSNELRPDFEIKMEVYGVLLDFNGNTEFIPLRTSTSKYEVKLYTLPVSHSPFLTLRYAFAGLWFTMLFD